MLPSIHTKHLALTIFLALYATDSRGDNTEYAPVDGFRNNLGQPTAGIAGSNFVRASPVAYVDGAYGMAGKTRPHPMEVSLKIHTGQSGQASMFSRNAMQAFYAQLVFDEIAAVSPGCPPEYENMALPDEHPFRNLTQRPQVYQRSLYDQSTGYLSGGPRQQINLASSFLDGGIIYGSSKTWTSLLRSYKDGKLLADSPNVTSSFPVYNDVRLPLWNAPIPRDHTLRPADRLFRLGNPKGHENPFLLALQIVWFRWHNKVAEDIIQSSHRNLTDEEIFQTAKKMVIAQFQKIVVRDWLPAFIYGNQTVPRRGVLPPYTKYDSRQNPGVTQEFLAAMDFRHTITPAAVWNLKPKALYFKVDIDIVFVIRSGKSFQFAGIVSEGRSVECPLLISRSRAGGRQVVVSIGGVTKTRSLHTHGDRYRDDSFFAFGWGNDINWLTLEEGFKKARQEHIPMMVIIHKMTCGACIFQKRWFSRSKAIQALSKNLAMVNLELHEVPKSAEFNPDGFYVPRILFFSPYGKMLSEVNVKYNMNYKFNYPQELDLTTNMKYVIDEYRQR